MGQLSALLGHDKLAAEILSALRSAGTRCWLTGPSGSGKTELASRVAELWTGDVHRMTGSREWADIRYLAANRALEGKRSPRAMRELDQQELTDFMKDVPLVGNSLAMIARRIIARTEENGPEFLTAEEQELCSGFQRASLTTGVLFIVDDVHWLDGGSLALIEKLRLPDVAAAYSFVERSSFLFVETSGQVGSPPSEGFGRLRSSAEARFSVSYPAQGIFREVLGCLGLTNPPDAKTCRKLHDLTRGHLKLAREIVRLLQEGSIEPQQIAARQDVTVDELAAALLRIRLSDLPAESDKLKRLLTIAACIGRSFSRRELECAFKDPAAFVRALDLARREEYLAGEGDALQFAHDIVRAALRSMETEDGPLYHDQLAECIRQLRPGDYRSRLLHSLRASNHQRTAELACTVLLQLDRGEETPTLDERALEPWLGELAPMATSARAARRNMDGGHPREAIQELLPHYTAKRSLVQAELAYLLALNYYKCRTVADYGCARAVLEPWIPRRDEGEVWHRLMLTLAVVYDTVGERNKCSDTVRRVQAHLERTAGWDHAAASKLQVLNRKAEIFYPLEIAGSLIQEAVDYFAPPPGARVPRNAFQYLAALVNLAANLYGQGEFGRAVEVARQAVQWTSELSGKTRTVEPYKVFNNYAIAAYRAAEISAADAKEVLLTFEDVEDIDRVLLATNAAVFTILAGETDQGNAMLESLVGSLDEREVDAYYLVYPVSDLAVSQHLIGNTARAHALLDQVDRYLDGLKAELQPCFRKRQSALRKAFEDPSSADAQAIDQYPAALYGKGPHVAWGALGRGFIMSDIQVWSES